MNPPEEYTIEFIRKYGTETIPSQPSKLISKWGDNYLLNPVFIVILKVGPPWYRRKEAFALSTCDLYKTETCWINIVDIRDADVGGYLVRQVMAGSTSTGNTHGGGGRGKPSNNKIIQFLDERYRLCRIS